MTDTQCVSPQTSVPPCVAFAAEVAEVTEMGKRILVVDDEPDVVTYLAAVLRDHGYETLEAYDGEEALGKVLRDKPDLVTLDITMPEITGVRAYRTHVGPGLPEPAPGLPAPLLAGRRLPRDTRFVVRAILGGPHHEYGLEKSAA
jgi:hypothetical protein